MTDLYFRLRHAALARLLGCLLLAVAWLCAAPPLQAQASSPPARTADYIVAVINQELVTNSELESRMARVRSDAARSRTPLPPAGDLRRQVLDSLIEERVQISHARESGQRVDEPDLDRAVNNVALQNQLTPDQLRERLRQDGLDYGRFRNNVRDQLLVERLREREVQGRIKVTDQEIDAVIAKRRAEGGTEGDYDIAQILVAVPENASVAEVAERRVRAESALARVKAGESFEAVASDVSDDPSKAQGGALGRRSADRLPDVFLAAVRPLKAGDMAPTLLRTGAGFHALKLLAKTDTGGFALQQTRARHILLRVSPQLPQDAAIRRLADFKRQIKAGARSFEQLARDNSEDGSAAQGGELGWASAGNFVPEFEEAMNQTVLGDLTDPVVSRFGVHLIQVLERREVQLEPKQQREQARVVLRAQKFEEAYAEWIRDLRARAYIEFREPPQ